MRSQFLPPVTVASNLWRPPSVSLCHVDLQPQAPVSQSHRPEAKRNCTTARTIVINSAGRPTKDAAKYNVPKRTRKKNGHHREINLSAVQIFPRVTTGQRSFPFTPSEPYAPRVEDWYRQTFKEISLMGLLCFPYSRFLLTPRMIHATVIQSCERVLCFDKGKNVVWV